MDTVLNASEFLSSVVLSGVLFALVVFLQSMGDEDRLEVFGVRIDGKYIFFVSYLYTLAHMYAAWIFARAVQFHVESCDARDCFLVLSGNGPLIFLSMGERDVTVVDVKGFIIPIIHLKTEDPTTWLYYAFGIVLIYAFWSSASHSGYSSMVAKSLAIFFVVVNWAIGSYWNYYTFVLQNAA